MSTKFSKGALVWVRHPSEAWRPGAVREILSKGRLKVFFADGKEEVIKITNNHPLLRTIPCEGDIQLPGGELDEDQLFSDDLTKMTQLITPAVLHCLHKSYKNGRFYSKLGSGTVLAVNPFKEVPDLFTLNTIQSYHSVSLSELQLLPAHVYAAAQSALVSLRAAVGRVNQSIIVSGESGAGKTWTVRCLMRYLAEVGIEYKRRLSSEDISSTPLKGYHATPIRASMKHSISDVKHVRSIKNSNEWVSVNAAGDNRVNSSTFGSTSDDLVNVTMETDRKPSSSFENISENNLNVNNNKVMKSGGFSWAKDAGEILTFDEDPDTEEEVLDLEVDDDNVLADMEETVADLNTSIQIVDRIERRILHSNPILEAFGNAHTLRNENSSRFGKYIQLQYDRSGTIVGAQLRTYLLEKTRAVRHDPGERSYHIFYQMLHGASDVEREEWKLPENPFPEDAKVFSVEDNEFWKKQKKDFIETRTSMLRIGISAEAQIQIFKLLSGLLHLRQLTFEGSDDLQNPCTLEESNELNPKSLETAAELIGVDKQTIMKVITFREIIANSKRRKSVYHRPSTVEECYSRRDSLAKLVYEVLFHWIVQRVGDSVCAPQNRWCSFIGLLDVYGFESFENNSLEQLCINYANEKLQQHFVSSFLREQQEEYTSEGVAWTPVDLTDNVDCLLALEAPRTSLFSLLNEECRLNRSGAGGQLKSRVESMFSKSKFIVQPRISTAAPSFSVVHYAGKVSYRTENLIEKNKDEVPLEITHLLAVSTNQFVHDLVNQRELDGDSNNVFASEQMEQAPPQNKGKHRPTVLTRFKKSLDELLDTLASTDCHYIRCIKPNKQSVPDVFDSKFVLSQLEACGVVETIRVCAPAHPNKLSYDEFLRRYGFLLRKRNLESTPLPVDNWKEPSKKKRCCSFTSDELRKDACERILRMLQNGADMSHSSAEKSPLQYGRTKIFLSSDLFESLEASRSDEIVRCTSVIQRVWRGYALRKRCREERKAIIAKRENAASVIQRSWTYSVRLRKSRVERKMLITKRQQSAETIQKCWILHRRKKVARIKRRQLIAKRENAALKIQSVYRGWRIRYKYKDLLDAWKQLKLLPEREYRLMVQRRLQLLLGPEPSLSPSPSYEAIRATFQMPTVTQKPSQPNPSIDATPNELNPPITPPPILISSADHNLAEPSLATKPKFTVYYETSTGYNANQKTNEPNPPTEHLAPPNTGDNTNREKLTVYYESTSSRRNTRNQNIVSNDLDESLNLEFLLPHISGSNVNAGSNTSTPSRQNPAMHESFVEVSPIHDQTRSTVTKLQSMHDAMSDKLKHYGTQIRHAKIIRSSSEHDHTRVKVQRSTFLPKFPKGPGIIYVWHNRAVISMMTSKRPLSLSSDPLTLIEMQYNCKSSVLTTPFTELHAPKRHRVRKIKRHGNRHHGLVTPPHRGNATSSNPQSGSAVILKFADTPPNSENSLSISFELSTSDIPCDPKPLLSNGITPEHHRVKKPKHRHSNTGQPQQKSTLKFGTWSPGQFSRLSRSGSKCILAHADVPPRFMPS